MNPLAAFYEKPVSIDDVLASPMIAEPLRLLEIVMPCAGGAAVVLASPEKAKKSPHRPVQITGYGESLTIKTPTFAEDLAVTPVAAAAATAFARAGTTPAAMDLLALYDCYTITVAALEDAGFCPGVRGRPSWRSGGGLRRRFSPEHSWQSARGGAAGLRRKHFNPLRRHGSLWGGPGLSGAGRKSSPGHRYGWRDERTGGADFGGA